MTRLPPVLSRLDLPLPELQAARLDGELFALEAGFAPIDEVPSTRHRAHAVHAGLPQRLIAEQLSAAWVWGAAGRPPARHQFCVALGARVRRASSVVWTVREVVIADDEVTSFDGHLVTTPLRTVLDLLRFAEDFGEAERRICAELMRLGGFGAETCLTALERRRNLPGKRRTQQRLAGLPRLGAAPPGRAVQPELTR